MSDKSAIAQYPINELIKDRWSPLAFSDQPVTKDTLESLLEAARWSSSSYNEQPWRYIIATKDNPDAFNRLLSCLAEGNQEWAKNAPVLMLSVAKLNFTYNGAENRHAFHDVGAASTTLAIQATALGLFLHQMAGFDVEKARTEFKIPEGYEPVAAIALGYPGDPATLSEKSQQREAAPRSRKPVDDFAFFGNWEGE